MWLKDTAYVKRIIYLSSSGWGSDEIIRQVATEYRADVSSTNVEHSIEYVTRLYWEAVRDQKINDK